MPRHQLLPGLLDGQACVATLSYLPVPPVLRGQAGHPKHAECVQPHLQLVGPGDFLGSQEGDQSCHILGTQPTWPKRAVYVCVCVCACLSGRWQAALSVSGDIEAWGTGMDLSRDYWGKGIAGKRMERHLGLQKGPWTEGPDLGSLTRKVPSRGFPR